MAHLKIPGLILALFTIASGQWEPDVRLTYNDSTSHTCYTNARSIALGSNGTVHVVWYDHRTGVDQIYYKRSTDRGTTWSTDTNLTDTTGMKTDPALAVAGETVHVVWADHRFGYPAAIMYRRSTDNGTSWSAEVCLHASSWNSRNPAIAVTGSTVHVAWASDSVGREIYYIRSADNGTTWSPRRRLTFDPQQSWYPSIASSGRFVHLAWEDWRDHSFEIYYLRSTDSGATWDSSPVRLSGDLTTGSCSPSLCVSDSFVHVVWFDTRHTPFELYYRCSSNNGQTWDRPEQRITTDSSGSYNPTISAIGPNVHIVWEALLGTADIYHKMSTDNGITWQPETRLTNDNFHSATPSLAILDSGVHVVWTDFRDNENGEIYYKRNLNGNPIAVGEHNPSADIMPSTATAFVSRGVKFPHYPVTAGPAPACLFNANGERIKELLPGTNDIPTLPAGIYLLLKTPKDRTICKIVVIK